VPVPSQESERSCINFASVSTISLLDFNWICSHCVVVFV
jgi:hypothetical protein